MKRTMWMTAAAVLALGVLTTAATASPPVVRGILPARPVRPAVPAVNSFGVSPYNVAPAYTLPTPSIPINPNYYVSPGLTIRQAAYNQALMNYGTYANTPYSYYNPFVTAYNFGPAYSGYPSYYPSYYSGYGTYGGY